MAQLQKQFRRINDHHRVDSDGVKEAVKKEEIVPEAVTDTTATDDTIDQKLVNVTGVVDLEPEIDLRTTDIVLLLLTPLMTDHQRDTDTREEAANPETVNDTTTVVNIFDQTVAAGTVVITEVAVLQVEVDRILSAVKIDLEIEKLSVYPVVVFQLVRSQLKRTTPTIVWNRHFIQPIRLIRITKTLAQTITQMYFRI